MRPQDASTIHQGQPVLTVGTPLDQAKAAVIMIHGRGASAEDILGLSAELPNEGAAFLAPQAYGGVWYPFRFMEPIRRNQPYLDSALRVIADLMAYVQKQGITQERIMLLGFSQGACLALEYSIRTGGRFGGVMGLSGGLIGEPGTAWDFATDLAGTTIFLGCDDEDFHIPAERVHESADVLTAHGAHVTKRLYQGMGHIVSLDEIAFVRQTLEGLLA